MTKRIGWYGTIVYVLMVWTIFQEFALGIMYHFIHIAPLIKVIFFSKDVLLVILYAAALFRIRLPRKLAILQICYLPFVIYGVLASLVTKSVSVSSMLSASRGVMLLPAFLTIGYAVRPPEAFLSIVKRRYMKLLVIVAVFGILDYILDVTIGTKKFWTDFVQLGTYMNDVKDRGGVLADNLPANFYTYSALGRFTQKRLVSFWAGPLTSGYCLLIPFMYYFITEMLYHRQLGRRERILNMRYLCIVGVALLLTFTRGIILPVIAFAMLCLLYRYRTDGGRLFLALAGMLLIGLAGLVVFWDKIFGYVYNGSTLAHFLSVSSAIRQIGILGKGAGTFAAATTEGVWTESAFISIAGQLGIIAMIIYMMIFIQPIKSVLKQKNRLDRFIVSVALSGIILFATGIISSQLTAYTSIAPYFIISGSTMRYAIKNQNNLLPGGI